MDVGVANLLFALALGLPAAAPPTAAEGAAVRAELGTLGRDRDAAQAELARLGDLIAEKKAALPAGAEAGPELTDLLRSSAALAERIADLQRRIAGIGQRLRSSLGAPPPAPTSAGPLSPTAGDDARSLREKANFLRDREDALRSRATAVGRRIAALERERALARRVSELAREQDLFDDDDRRVAVTRSEYVASTPSSTATGLDGHAVATNLPAQNGNSGGPVAAGGAAGGGMGGAAGQTNTLAAGSLGSLSPQATPPAGSESLPGRSAVSGERPEDVHPASLDDDDSLDDLQAQRAALEREADELRKAAQALDRSAESGR